MRVSGCVRVCTCVMFAFVCVGVDVRLDGGNEQDGLGKRRGGGVGGKGQGRREEGVEGW